MNSSTRSAVLVIAGSDSSGGAGISRDLYTLNDFNVAGLCALTAVTAQSNTQVAASHCLPPALIQQQIRSAFATRRIAAIKIGMLGTAAIVQAVAQCLPSREHIPIVLDPVLSSSSGTALLDEAGVNALREQLLPLATVATPNLMEAAALLRETLATHEATQLDQAQRLLQLGSHAVLLKGGHAQHHEACDLLVTAHTSPLRLTAPRIMANLRGTGCALASAIAASLAADLPLPEACRRAKQYVLKQLRNAI